MANHEYIISSWSSSSRTRPTNVSTANIQTAGSSPSSGKKNRFSRGRPSRIGTPTTTDEVAVSRAVTESRSRSVSMSPSRRLVNQTKQKMISPSVTQLSADVEHHQMFGIKRIQQDLSDARNKSQQIAALVQYQEALSEIFLSAADEIQPNQLEKDLRREPVRVNGHLITEMKEACQFSQACCRTNSGGDSYFVLTSLFEAADVLVTPAHGRTTRPTDIRIGPDLATIRTHNCYQVQNHEYVGVESTQAQREKTIYDTVLIETIYFKHISGTEVHAASTNFQPKSVRILCISSNDFYVSPLPSAPRSRKFTFTNDKKLQDICLSDLSPSYKSSTASKESHATRPQSAMLYAQQLLNTALEDSLIHSISKCADQPHPVDQAQAKSAFGTRPNIFSSLSVDSKMHEGAMLYDSSELSDEEGLDFTESDSFQESKRQKTTTLQKIEPSNNISENTASNNSRGRTHHQFTKQNNAQLKHSDHLSSLNHNNDNDIKSASSKSPVFRSLPSVSSPTVRRHWKKHAANGAELQSFEKLLFSPKQQFRRGAAKRLHGTPTTLSGMSPASCSARLLAYPHVPAGSPSSIATYSPAGTPSSRHDALPRRLPQSLPSSQKSRARIPGEYLVDAAAFTPKGPKPRSDHMQTQTAAISHSKHSVHVEDKYNKTLATEQNQQHETHLLFEEQSVVDRMSHGYQSHGQFEQVTELGNQEQQQQEDPEIFESQELICPECKQRCGTLLTFIRHWGRLHAVHGTNIAGSFDGQYMEEESNVIHDDENIREEENGKRDRQTKYNNSISEAAEAVQQSPLAPVVLSWNTIIDKSKSVANPEQKFKNPTKKASSLAYSHKHELTQSSQHQAVNLFDTDEDAPPPPVTDEDAPLPRTTLIKKLRNHSKEHGGHTNLNHRLTDATETNNINQAKHYWDPDNQAFFAVNAITGESWWV